MTNRRKPWWIGHGRCMGALPRTTRFGEVTGTMVSDVVDVIDPSDWDDILRERKESGAETFNRRDVQILLGQDGVNSCQSDATSGGMQVVMARSGMPVQKLNPWSLYRQINGGRDRGAAIGDTVRAARDVGVLPADYFPRYADKEEGRVVHKWSDSPPTDWRDHTIRIDEAHECSTIAEVGTALLLGWPVIIGWHSHAECLVGIDDERTCDVLGSWLLHDYGEEVRDGFHHERLSQIDFRYEAYALRTVRDYAGVVYSL